MLQSSQIDATDTRAGISAEALITRLRQHWAGDVRWREAPDDDLDANVTPLAGSLELAAQTAIFEESRPIEADGICDGSALRVSARVLFVTEDDAFNEDLTGQVRYDTTTQATTWRPEPVPLSAFQGQLNAAAFGSEFESPFLFFVLRFEPELSGQVSLGDLGDTTPPAGAYTIATVGDDNGGE